MLFSTPSFAGDTPIPHIAAVLYTFRRGNALGFEISWSDKISQNALQVNVSWDSGTDE